ncbi:hypothetical protein IWQ49_006770, partial [Labrenzia sp. EL_126]|nr:hypothetical protein [Labrenzia sp. EL_126]
EAGISQAAYFNWRKKYAGLMPSELKRLRELEQESARLTKIVIDLSFDKEILRDIVKRNVWSTLSLQGSFVATTQFA